MDHRRYRTAVTGLVALLAGALSLSGCGSDADADACAPFNSCDAVIEIALTETITSAELNTLCDEWNDLTLGEQERLAEQFADQTDQLAVAEGMGMFEDPDAAAEGIVTAFLDGLNTRCS